MMNRMIVIGLMVGLVQLVTGDSQGPQIKISVFNVEIFGQSKMESSETAEILSDIVHQNDLLIMQEVRDNTGQAPEDLLTIVNTNSSIEYALLTSERFGVEGASHQEQYAYYYNINKLIPFKNISWDHLDSLFPRRSPHAVWWNISGSEFTPITVVMHMSPDYVWQELDALGTAINDTFSSLTEDEGLIIGGDFNADCAYLNVGERDCLRDPACSTYGRQLLFSEDFSWLINDDVDTTTSNSDCAYDRIVVSNTTLAYLNGTATVDRFDLVYGLNITQTDDVSDHYPVVLTLDLPPIAPPPITSTMQQTTNSSTQQTTTSSVQQQSSNSSTQLQITPTTSTTLNVTTSSISTSAPRASFGHLIHACVWFVGSTTMVSMLTNL